VESKEDKNGGFLSRATSAVRAGVSLAAGARSAALGASARAASVGGSALSSTARMFYQGLTSSVQTYTVIKDAVRTIGMAAPTVEQRTFSSTRINELLNTMEVDPELKESIMTNVRNTRTLLELNRTIAMLEVFDRHGLKGEAANQFFLGGHFRLNDGAGLFRELKALEGAETRFSSHFANYRTEELGISAGRILPEVLFIETVQDGERYSHFQVEASPWRAIPGGGVRNFIPTLQTLQNMEHISDSVIYFAAKKLSEYRHDTVYNRSNYGWSPYADDNPIITMDQVSAPRVEAVAELDHLLDAEIDEPALQVQAEEELEDDLEKKDDFDHILIAIVSTGKMI
jgi:hypothetical protein